ncbi:MAG: phosphoserine phosphatase SerB [Pseudolabrys sp.]|nr:phosphoserine phosphatase SerB [Pseudolabrys sp.]
MLHVATVIAASEILDAAVARLRAVLPTAGDIAPLGADAVDIPFSAEAGIDQRGFAERLRAATGLPIDVVIQPAGKRRKRLFLADMDSTMIQQECIDELADYVGLKAHVAAITERAMRGDIAFEPALRERVALLRGLPISVVNDVVRDRIRLTPGARTLVATMRAHGAHTCLVSGGFTLFADRIAAMIGFDEVRANTLTLDGERLAGTVAEPIFGRAQKHATLVGLCRRLGLDKSETLVAGDGANDLDMIADAGLGVAFHAKPPVAAAAPARIDHADLTALLYVQGYRRQEFVEG